jgi:hypothetical protein
LNSNFLRVGLRVLNRGLHFDQIGVGGQHAGIVGDAVLARHVDDDLALDRPRQVPVVAGTGDLMVLAEAQNDGALLGIDPVHAAADPHRADQGGDAAKPL